MGPRCFALAQEAGHAKHARLVVKKKSNVMVAGRTVVTALLEALDVYIHKMPEEILGRPRLVFKVLRSQLQPC